MSGNMKWSLIVSSSPDVLMEFKFTKRQDFKKRSSRRINFEEECLTYRILGKRGLCNSLQFTEINSVMCQDMVVQPPWEIQSNFTAQSRLLAFREQLPCQWEWPSPTTRTELLLSFVWGAQCLPSARGLGLVRGSFLEIKWGPCCYKDTEAE